MSTHSKVIARTDRHTQTDTQTRRKHYLYRIRGGNYSFFFRRFVSRLPDKGKRISELADRLRSILSLHAEVDSTADLLDKMSFDADYKYRYTSCFGLESAVYSKIFELKLLDFIFIIRHINK